MISERGEKLLEVLKVVSSFEKVEGNLLTLEQITEGDENEVITKNLRRDLARIKQILEVMVGNPRFEGSQDNKFIVETLGLTKQFFSGVLDNKGFDADSFIGVTDVVRPLINQIFSSHNFLDALILKRKRETRRALRVE